MKKKYKILVADDDKNTVKLINSELTRAGFKVVFAYDGAKALSLAKEDRPDLIILDLIMPIVDGFKVCKAVKKEFKEEFLPILVVTVKDDEDTKLKSFRLGADDYLVKPFNAKELLARVKSLLQIKDLHDELYEIRREMEERNLELESLNREMKKVNDELLDNQETIDRQKASLAQDLVHSEVFARFNKNINLLDLDEILNTIKIQLPALLEMELFSLFFYDKESDELTLITHNHPRIPEKHKVTRSERSVPPLHEKERGSVMFEAIDSREPVYLEDYTKSEFFKGIRRKKYYDKFSVTIPLVFSHEVVGVINLNNNDKGYYTPKDLNNAAQAAEHLVSVISNARLYKRIQRIAVIDGLTGLTNHRQLHKLFDLELKRALRYNSPFSCVMMDIDRFKNVNDTFGHLFGDYVLKEIAGIIRATAREVDIISRYGGEEFFLVLPHTDLAGGMATAERIRSNVEANVFTLEDMSASVSISGGVSAFPEHKAASKNDFIRLADLACYEAKLKGRNMICRFDERRAGIRVQMNGELKYKVHLGREEFQELEKMARLGDLGPGGINLMVPEKLDVGANIGVEFSLDAKPMAIKTKGKLVWCKDAGKSTPGLYRVGISFPDISKLERKKLDEILKYGDESIKGSLTITKEE